MNVKKILKWHKTTRGDPGQHVGVFIPLPDELANQFPADGKAGEDSSPPHVTVLYVGDLEDLEDQEEFIDVVEEATNSLMPFEVSLGPVEEFKNEGQRVTHSSVKGKDIHKLHKILVKALKSARIPFSDKHPVYSPHVTIEYVNDGEEEKYADKKPSGDWVVDHFWIWGTNEPHLVKLGI